MANLYLKLAHYLLRRAMGEINREHGRKGIGKVMAALSHTRRAIDREAMRWSI